MKEISEKTIKNPLLTWVILAVILGVALALRLAGIWRTEPIDYHPDEWVLAKPIMQIANEGNSTIKAHYRRPATSLIYSIGYSLYSLKCWFGPYSYNSILVILRVVAALFGTATVFVVFLFMRRLFSIRTALTSAALVSVAKLPVVCGHEGTIITAVPFAVLTIMWLCIDLFETSSGNLHTSRCIAVGLIYSFGMAAKWEVLFAAIPISGAFLLAVWSSKGKIPYRRFFQLNFKRLLIIAFAAVLGFLVAVPDIYFVPDKIVDGLLFEAKHFQTGHYGEVLIEEKELGPCIWRRIEMLCAAGSIYWFIPGMLSLLCCIAKPRREHFLLVWSFIIWMLMLATNELAGERHHLTPFIFMVMMISVGLSIILEIKFRRASVLWSGLLAFLLVVELIYSCIFASPFWKPDARIECANWIKANVPLGSGVTWAPRTYNWMAPGKVVAPWLFQLYPRNPEQGKAQYIIAANAQMNIFKKHPPTRKIVPIEWFPTEPPTEDELRFYAEINAGGGPNLTLVKEFHTKPSFLGLDLRLFAMEPIQDTSSANRAVTLFRVNAPGTK